VTFYPSNISVNMACAGPSTTSYPFWTLSSDTHYSYFPDFPGQIAKKGPYGLISLFTADLNKWP
jgi:hypothetical protein